MHWSLFILLCTEMNDARHCAQSLSVFSSCLFVQSFRAVFPSRPPNPSSHLALVLFPTVILFQPLT
jgi:hypothetical protein